MHLFKYAKVSAHGIFKCERFPPCFSSCHPEFSFGCAIDVEPPGVRNTCHLSGRTASSWVGLAGAEAEGDRGYTQCLHRAQTKPLVPFPEHAVGSASGRSPQTPGTRTSSLRTRPRVLIVAGTTESGHAQY